MKRRITLWMTLCMGVLTLVAAARMDVALLSVDDRLPKDIKEVYVDSEGFVWYVTDGGLYQDDGYHITSYRADIQRPNLMKSNHVTAIAEDACQRIWIGTRRGAYVLDKRTYAFTALADAEVVDHVVNTIDATRDGQVWLSTNENLLRYDAQGRLAARYPINHKVQQLYEDSRGDVWRILWRKGLERYEAAKDSFIAVEWPFAEHPAYMVEHRATGTYWVSVWERGVVRYSPKADSLDCWVWQDAGYSISSAEERKLHDLHTWLDGQYLCATQEGGHLQLFEVTEADTLRRMASVEADSLIPCGLNREYVHAMVDADGRLWLTDADSEIQALKKATDHVEGTRYVGQCTPVTFIVENKGCWLQDGFTRKYNYWNISDDRFIRLPNSDKIIGVAKARNQTGIYAVRKYNDLVRFSMDNGRLRTEQVFAYSLLDDERVRTFYEDAAGRFWLGTNKRLLYYDVQNALLQPAEGVQGLVLSIASDKRGCVYAITEGRHMYRLAMNDKAQVSTYTLHEDFSRLVVSRSGDVWGITQQGGLYQFRHATDEFVSFAKEMGLTGEAIMDVAFDAYNRIWLLYNNRLIIYDPGQKDGMPRVVNATSPVLDLDALWSLYRKEAGEMYVGGTKGVVAFDSTCFVSVDSLVQVPLRLTGVQTGDLRRMVPVMKPSDVLRLKAEDSDVQLFFSTLYPAGTGQVRMAWRYRGWPQWTLLPEGSNEIHMTDLQRGDYRIEVRATTPDGEWGSHSLELTVRRPWPWYLSMWARIGYFVVVCGLVAWGMVRLRRSIEWQKQRATTNTDSDSVDGFKPSEEDSFMQQVQALIEKNLSNAEYSIEDLSRDMAMSRASLHRKVKAASGITPTELMRSRRLNRAAELLKEGHLNINEVAYSVGFSTPGYFTQLFKKQFGVLPSEYQ